MSVPPVSRMSSTSATREVTEPTRALWVNTTSIPPLPKVGHGRSNPGSSPDALAPLAGTLVGGDDRHVLHTCAGEHLGEQRCRRDRAQRHSQSRGLVAVHVESDHMVHPSGVQQVSGPPDAKALSGLSTVLACIAQVWQHGDHTLCPLLLERVGEEQQREHLLVRRRQRAERAADAPSGGPIQPQVHLSVGEAQGLAHGQLEARALIKRTTQE